MGSEMCIRDRIRTSHCRPSRRAALRGRPPAAHRGHRKYLCRELTFRIASLRRSALRWKCAVTPTRTDGSRAARTEVRIPRAWPATPPRIAPTSSRRTRSGAVPVDRPPRQGPGPARTAVDAVERFAIAVRERPDPFERGAGGHDHHTCSSGGATWRRKPSRSASRASHASTCGMAGPACASTCHRRAAAPAGMSPIEKRLPVT